MRLDPTYGSDPPPHLVPSLLEARKRIGEDVQASDWARRVKLRDPCSLLDSRTVINRCYWKMKELSVFVEYEPRNVLLLCEAPGGFAQACSNLWPRARCRLTSLTKGGGEGEGRRIGTHPRVAHMDLNLCNDDILDREMEKELIQKEGECCYDLITADGGKEVSDLDLSEQECTRLALCQVAVGLKMQSLGGSMIVKLFEGSTLPTRQLMCTLKSIYRESVLYKPRTSKCCNSERYAIFICLRSAKMAAELSEDIRLVLSEEHAWIHSLYRSPSPSSFLKDVSSAFEQFSSVQEASIRELLENDEGKLKSRRKDDIDWLHMSGCCFV